MTMLPASITIGSLAEAGRVKAIGVAAPHRGGRLPNVPTFAESSTLSDYTAPEMWAGVMVPANTPADIVAVRSQDVLPVSGPAIARGCPSRENRRKLRAPPGPRSASRWNPAVVDCVAHAAGSDSCFPWVPTSRTRP